jgi:TonB-linked SusC/RagA family outer membrane protein
MERCLPALGRLLIITLLITLSMPALGQDLADRLITIDLNQSPFADALTRIGQQAGVQFVYTFTADPTSMKVTLHVHQKKLRAVLTDLLAPYHLDYQVMGNKIILKPRPPTAISPPDTSRMRIWSLNPVVITALGILKPRVELGYAVTQIDGNTLTEARENNVMNALEGRVPGMNVAGMATGPGASANVLIRGVSSMTGSSQPLYVVDGVPITNVTYTNPDTDGYGGYDGGDGIGNINPDDIETISVLRGAAASALYGYRGSRGVVLITTKSGNHGNNIGVEVNSNFVVERVIDNTDWQHTYGQGYASARPDDQMSAIGSGMYSWGAKLDGQPTPQFDGVSRPYSAQRNNLRNFYRDGVAFTNTVALSKGFGDEGSIRFSVSDLRDHSMVPDAGLKRQSFHLSAKYQMDKHLSVDLKANYIAQQTRNSPNISDAPANMNFAAMFLPVSVNIRSLAPGYTPEGNELRFSEDEYTTNPYFAARRFSREIDRNRFIGIGTVKYTFDNGLFLQARSGEDFFIDHGISITPTGTAYLPDGSLVDNTYRSSELNLDGLIGRQFRLKSDLVADVRAGANFRRSVAENTVVQGYGFNVPFVYNIGNLSNTTPSYARPVVENRSLYATADFDYRHVFYLNITGRRDWYSTLAPGKITYLYPSVNGAYVFADSKQFFGKLRFGYAVVGGEADDAYQTTLNYNTLTNINGLPVGNIVNIYVPNKALRPSSAKELELGTQFSLWNNRLQIDLAAYHKKITNSIIPATTSETSGYNGAYLNLGSLRNNGIEWMFTGSPVTTKRFHWSVTVNGSYNDNKVLQLAPDEDNLLVARSRAGEDNGENAYIAQVVGKPAAQIMALDPARDAHGKVIIDPGTGTPDPSNAVYKAFGTGIDPWNIGLTNDFSYKNFDLSFLLNGKFGGKIFSGSNYYGYMYGLSKATLTGREQLYGDGINTPQLSAEDYYARLTELNSRFIYDASFIKLRQVVLGYNFPGKKITLSLVMRNVLTLMKHTPNIDPESNYSNGTGQGLELAGVPPFRSFGLNLNIKL